MPIALAEAVGVTNPPFLLSQEEMRAVVRQTYHQHIPHEGTSGPVLHALLDRIRAHVGKATYDAFVAETPRGPQGEACPLCKTGLCAVHGVYK